MSAAEVLAEALRRDGWTCEYHEPEDRGVCGGCDEAHDRTAARQLDALKAAGYAVVKLDLPHQCIIPTGWGEDCLGAWPAILGEDPVSAWPNGKVVTPDDKWLEPSVARSLAAALLVAADVAENGSETTP